MLAAWHRRWEVRLREAEERVMATVVAMAEDPDDAILPASQTAAGRAGHGLANALGTLGEAIDGSVVGPRRAQGPAARLPAQPQPHVLQRRRRDDLLPAARAEHEDPLGLAQRDQRPRRADGRGQRRLAERPVAVVARAAGRPCGTSAWRTPRSSSTRTIAASATSSTEYTCGSPADCDARM